MFENLFNKDETVSSIKYEETDVINLINIKQTYTAGKNTNVLFDNLSFSIKDIKQTGQFVSVVGRSGCGKSSILRYIAGLQKPTSGEILIYGKKKTVKDRIPMVFQQYSSFPWKTVIENVALPLLMKGVSFQEAYDKAQKMIELVDLKGHENKWARYPLLSGGQLQRIAIARNLIASPQILLMDEPFGALDIFTRNKMQELLCKIFNSSEVDPTVVFVTHDISEAVLLSNVILIMDSNPGRISHTIEIDLPTIRDSSTKKDRKFIEYVSEIESIMYKMNI